jgi:hypothetical protein
MLHESLILGGQAVVQQVLGPVPHDLALARAQIVSQVMVIGHSRLIRDALVRGPLEDQSTDFQSAIHNDVTGAPDLP